MKTRYTVLVLVICFIYGSAFSQEKTTSITVSPAIISFRTVALQPGVEYHFSKRWSISGEFCYAKPPERRTYFDKTVLLRSAVELKRFVNTRGNPAYFSFQTSYFFRKLVSDTSGLYYFQKLSDSVDTYSSAVVHSPILTMAIKVGTQRMVGNKFFLDLFMGMGTRTSFTHYDAENIQRKRRNYPADKIFPSPESSYLFNFILTRFHMTAGIKLGFVL